jgi:hypothetical protein
MMIRSFVIGMLGLLLVGCAAMPLSSMWALRKLELETTDFSSWRAALKSPSFVRTTAATLKVDVVEADGNNRSGNFTLIEAADSLAALRRVTTAQPGEQLGVYRLSDEDVAKLEGIRAEVVQANGTQKGRMSIGVSAQGCSVGLIPSGPVRLSTYLKTTETLQFVALMEGLDLLKYSDGKTAAELFKPCENKR